MGKKSNRHSVPKYYEMVRATLASLRKRGGVASNQEIEDDIVAGMNLSEAAAAELHGKGPQTKVGYNAGLDAHMAPKSRCNRAGRGAEDATGRMDADGEGT